MGLNRFSYNHEEGIHVSNALSYAWRVFFYLNYFKVSNATLHCDNVAQAKIMMEVYRHFFIGTYLEGEHEPEFVQRENGNGLYIPMEGDKVYELWKEHILLTKIKKYEHVCFSILSNSKDIKGLDDHCIETLTSCFNNARMVDLGDSRNFENYNHCLSKTKLFMHSSMYIGSDTSWNNLAPLFKIPVVLTVQEYPYMSDTVFKKNILINRKTGHPIGYTPTN